MLLLQATPVGTLFSILGFFVTIVGIIFLVMYNLHAKKIAEQQALIAEATKLDASSSIQNNYILPGNIGQSISLQSMAAMLGIKEKFTKMTRIEGVFLNDKVIDIIMELFDKCETLSEFTEARLDGRTDAGNVVLKIIHNGECILFTYRLENYKDSKDRAMMNCVIYHDRKTSFKFSEIMEILKKNKYIMPVKSNTQNNFTMYQIGRIGNEFTTIPVKSHTSIKDEHDLESSYEPVELRHKGTTYSVSLKDLVPGIVLAMKDKHNVYITGSVGTGKTVLAGYICYKLVEANIGKVFYMNAATIASMLTPDFVNFAGSIFGSNNSEELTQKSESFVFTSETPQESGKQLNIIIIDEAQSVLRKENPSSDILLSLLDGEHKRQYNTVYLLIFNEDQREINSAAYRAGRVDVSIHLTPLKKNTADKAVDLIKTNLDTSKNVFDNTKYAEILNTENILPNSDKPYAKAGEITLADTYSCVTPVAIENIIEKIAKEKGSPISAPSLVVKPKKK